MPARRAPTTQPARRGLNRDVIADVAMRVLDAEGLDAVTMRRVAQELGTGPASLYAHVSGKDDLFAILVDRAIGETPMPAPVGDWQEQVKEYVRLVRKMYTSHRDLARASMGVIPTGPNALRFADHVLGILRGGGLDDQTCAWAIDLLSLYGTAVAFEEGVEGEPDLELLDQIGEQFAALPADRYPNMAALAEALVTGDGDERFEFGLEILVTGLAARAR
ncbi:MAG: hypothetical protein QOI80_2380 [Solirubrobacteraceae bacterium]|nr:hypothetical protein [Solirubrobacteraceae bacterium]